jgi:hypothetical protein
MWNSTEWTPLFSLSTWHRQIFRPHWNERKFRGLVAFSFCFFAFLFSMRAPMQDAVIFLQAISFYSVAHAAWMFQHLYSSKAMGGGYSLVLSYHLYPVHLIAFPITQLFWPNNNKKNPSVLNYSIVLVITPRLHSRNAHENNQKAIFFP